MYTHGRNSGCRLSLDYTYKGMRIAYLENASLRVGVLLDKGADIFDFTYKPKDLDFMWQSPIPMRKPFTATSALPEGAFHDYYYGGWQEVLPSAGWASEPYMGTYQGLHGEASLLPFEASVLEDTPQQVTLLVKTALYRSPLRLEREMTLRNDAPTLFIKERLYNDADMDFAVMWGHHPAFGAPFLDESCQVQTAAGRAEVLAYHANGLWEPGDGYNFPMVKNRRSGELQDIRQVLPASTKSVDVVFFKELSEGWYGLTNRNLGVGFGMAWDQSVFPYLWMWQVYGGHTDYPWYGRTYNCALEPFSSYPPAGVKNAVDNGTARMLKPQEVLETELVAVAYEGQSISRISRAGEVTSS
ncbi:MAG: aldose 1-epimerase [Anaerolineae bacterium]|nr:aldose 1-epimerase [Anaerolineae bacterium]